MALGRPDLELDERNLITLCETEAGSAAENHHLLIGHLDDFESSNLSVVEDASSTFKGWMAAKIRADSIWLQKKSARLPHLPMMSADDKAAFAWAMNTRYPKIGCAPGPEPASLPLWLPGRS